MFHRPHKNADGQAGQEPVAWRFRFPTGRTWHLTEFGPHELSRRELEWQPLYTHPASACSAPEEELLWLERKFEIERLLQECDELFALARGVLRVDQSDGHRRIADQIRNTRKRIAAIREYIRRSAGKEKG